MVYICIKYLTCLNLIFMAYGLRTRANMHGCIKSRHFKMKSQNAVQKVNKQ